MPASGSDVVQVTNTAGWAPLESPDGAYLYYVETLDKPSPLWRLPASGGDPVKVLEGSGQSPHCYCQRPDHSLCAGGL